MDSFIDRLAHRFTAQEIIKANATAEAEELKRTREQVRQYETCLEEMKQVNESMKEALSKLENTMNADFGAENNSKLSAEDLQEINDMLDAVMVEISGTKEASLQQQTHMEEQLAGKMQELQDGINEQITAKLQEIRDGLAEQMQNVQDGLAEQMQSVQDGASGQMMEDVLAELASTKEASMQQQTRLEEQFAGQVQSVQESVSNQMQGIQDGQSKINNQLLSQMQDIREMQEFQSKLPSQLSSQLQSVQDKLIAQMRAERALATAEKENAGMFSDLQVAVLKEVASSHADASMEQVGTKLTEQKELLCDYMHKESVKVYRNVQAVVVDESNKQNENVTRMLSKITAKNQLMMKLIIASCACSGASLAAVIFLILRSLGII